VTLIYIEAVLPRDPSTLFSYCTDCSRSHYLNECRYRRARERRLREQVSQLRQELADVSEEIA
jgi:hypothetical protein